MKVVSNLTRHEFVAAQRSPGGDTRLNRPTEEIGLDEVLFTTEKHIELFDDGADPDPEEQSPTERLGACLNYALQSYFQVLGQFTLADVLGADPVTLQMMNPEQVRS